MHTQRLTFPIIDFALAYYLHDTHRIHQHNNEEDGEKSPPPA